MLELYGFIQGRLPVFFGILFGGALSGKAGIPQVRCTPALNKSGTGCRKIVFFRSVL